MDRFFSCPRAIIIYFNFFIKNNLPAAGRDDETAGARLIVMKINVYEITDYSDGEIFVN